MHYCSNVKEHERGLLASFFAPPPPKNPLAQMKPLFSKGGRREVYLPGDPRRREFEEQWRESGGDLAQLEGRPLEVDNGEAAKVGNGHVSKAKQGQH